MKEKMNFERMLFDQEPRPFKLNHSSWLKNKKIYLKQSWLFTTSFYVDCPQSQIGIKANEYFSL
jgi:hypothetical protein